MAITVTEVFGSRRSASGKNGWIEVLVIARGDNDDVALRAAINAWAIANVGATYDGAELETVELTEQLDNLLWTGVVRYTLRELTNAGAGDSTFEFNTTGSTQRTTYGNSVAAYPASYSLFGAAPDFAGAINVTDGGVEGVDVEFPGMDWSETHYFASADIDATFKANLYALTKKVNNATFKGFPAYTTQFRGAQGGGKIGFDVAAVTFNFRSGINLSNATIAGIPNIDKRAWEYLWLYYRPQEDAVAKAVVPQPVAAYVHEIPGYEPADFTDLGIGTT